MNDVKIRVTILHLHLVYSQMKRVPLYLTKVIFYGGALFPLHN